MHDPTVATWLEFHDMDVEGIHWKGDDLRMPFRFGTVYDAPLSCYGYRTGVIIFATATVDGSFPGAEDETWLWTGVVHAGPEVFKMIPIAGVYLPPLVIETRITFAAGNVTVIRSQQITVTITGLYQADSPEAKPAWNLLNG